MTLLVLIIVWFALSPIFALAIGAFIKAGRGPAEPLRSVPGLEAGRTAEGRPQRGISLRKDLAA
jgi:hypothetical protein